MCWVHCRLSDKYKQAIAELENSGELPERKSKDDNFLVDILQNIEAEEKSRLSQIIQDKDREITHWEYNYLNLFLVSNSKKVLFGMSQISCRVSTVVFHDLWDSLIPGHNEREAILSTLLRYGLISEEERSGMLEVTPNGHDYIKWARLDKLFPHSESSA